MGNWIRISLIVFVLIGGTALFGYWSLGQFEHVFENISPAFVADISSAPLSFKEGGELASTSPEILETIATSTSTSTPNLSLIFPKKSDKVYIGCTYLISWQASTTITSLEMALIDTGTLKPVGPIAGGIAKENIIDEDSQNLSWKVGVVWPGEYYIKISKINEQEITEKSGAFTVNKIPEGESKKDFCINNDI